ncbi:MAG: site-specific DNA-methyltransferase [Microthrixaceae bacterium]|nr:site-specific DNA-methyltransferase [Microthrixaceae bacterium]
MSTRRDEQLEPSGRLELTWANKHLRLISDPEGGYEWVDPADPRVSEVRLLQEVDTVGEEVPGEGNLLIEGDALHALTALNRIPELAKQYAGQVRLVYIDPPFNTGQAFAHYDDNLEHSVWLSMLRDRLVQLKPLLAPNGSIWVHLDDAEVHRCRCVMDEVLESANFINDRRLDGCDPSLLVHLARSRHPARLRQRPAFARVQSSLARTAQMGAAYTSRTAASEGHGGRMCAASTAVASAVTTPSSASSTALQAVATGGSPRKSWSG